MRCHPARPPACMEGLTRAQVQSHLPFCTAHRALKCENILLGDQGILKLTGKPVAQSHHSHLLLQRAQVTLVPDRPPASTLVCSRLEPSQT